MGYLAGGRLGRLALPRLEFDWLAVLGGLPRRASVALGLFYHRHPLQHRRPARHQLREAVVLGAKMREERSGVVFLKGKSVGRGRAPHVVVLLEESVVLYRPLLELHVDAAAVDADDAPDAAGGGGETQS